MKHKAFTLLEMLVTLALFGVILGMVLLYSQVSVLRTNLHTQVDTFVSYARLSQSYAASGKMGSSHGIYLEEDAYALFTGMVYNGVDTSNTFIELPPTIEIQNISLNGGGSTILFNAPHGGTTHYGSLDFFSTSLNQTLTLTIDASGKLDY